MSGLLLVFSLAVSLVLLETVLYFWRPNVLADFAFWPTAEKEISLDAAALDAIRQTEEATYRTSAGGRLDLTRFHVAKEAHERFELLPDSDLALMRIRFQPFQRHPFGLARIDASLSGEKLNLRAVVLPFGLSAIPWVVLPMVLILPYLGIDGLGPIILVMHAVVVVLGLALWNSAKHATQGAEWAFQQLESQLGAD